MATSVVDVERNYFGIFQLSYNVLFNAAKSHIRFEDREGR